MYKSLREQKQRRLFLILLAVIVISVSLSVAGISMLIRGQETSSNGGGADGENETEPLKSEESFGHKVLTYTDTWVVCLDPGHGFDDTGTESGYLPSDTKEADITLDVALKVRELLRAAGIEVLMTHDTNEIPAGAELDADGKYLMDPMERAAFANGHDIDLYVSIHCDSYEADETVSGMRTYYHLNGGRDKATEELAACIAEKFEAAVGGKKPVLKSMSADDAYYVIKHIDVPSVLTELGFVTNREDAEDMLTDVWRQTAAQGIADGILAYTQKG